MDLPTRLPSTSQHIKESLKINEGKDGLSMDHFQKVANQISKIDLGFLQKLVSDLYSDDAFKLKKIISEPEVQLSKDGTIVVYYKKVDADGGAIPVYVAFRPDGSVDADVS